MQVVDRLTLHVRFDFNKSTLKNPNDPDLQKAVEFVKKYPGSRVSVEGYTDDVGTDPYNQGLSERRAATVKNYLAQHGADALVECARMSGRLACCSTMSFTSAGPLAPSGGPQDIFIDAPLGAARR